VDSSPDEPDVALAPPAVALGTIGLRRRPDDDGCCSVALRPGPMKPAVLPQGGEAEEEHEKSRGRRRGSARRRAADMARRRGTAAGIPIMAVVAMARNLVRGVETKRSRTVAFLGSARALAYLEQSETPLR
jgi:hypothetical protein